MLPYHDIAIRRTVVEFMQALPWSEKLIGIDPGQVNMGVAVVQPDLAYLYELTLPSAANSIERIMASTHAVQYLLAQHSGLKAGCVEGAAYLAIQGQVPLAENRIASTIALLQGGLWPVEIVPPRKVRETVFLSGNLRSQEVWPELPKNAGSALGCALYLYKVLRL